MNKFKIDDNQKIGSGLKIPEGYFEDFQKTINDKIFDEEQQVISIFRNKKFLIYTVAACLIMSVSIPLYLYNANINQKIEQNYLVLDDHLSTEDLVELLSNRDIDVLEANINQYDEATISYAKQNLN